MDLYETRYLHVFTHRVLLYLCSDTIHRVYRLPHDIT